MSPSERLFIGVFPAGISYADRQIEEHGDYRKLAFLSYRTLKLELYKHIPPDVLPLIQSDASKLQARPGTQFVVSTCGHTVLLGERILSKSKP